MKPRLLNLAAGVSLLLAVAILALWVRSYGRHEEIARSWNTSTEQRNWNIQSRYSRLYFTDSRESYTGPPIAPSYDYWDWTRQYFVDPRREQRDWFPFPPALLKVSAPASSANVRHFVVAYWLLLLLTLPLPLIALVRHRRRRRRETNNLCPTCGYDLRATPDRCPECGAVPARGML